MFIYVLAYAFFPTWHDNFLPIVQFNNQTVKYIGLTLLFISLVWTVIAQGHMKNSWRIGIDTDTKTELVTSGLFSVSRNPIFFRNDFEFSRTFFYDTKHIDIDFFDIRLRSHSNPNPT
jgi:protein-S-isoprenylcysteine O-methyltransferase Ste14